MKVIQMLPTISYGDAVGNDTIAIKKLLIQAGYKDTKIYAENIDSRLDKDIAEHISNMPVLSDDDVIIYHGSTGTNINQLLPCLKGRKIMRYHNITPSYFFKPYSNNLMKLVESGQKEFKSLYKTFDYCLADSSYNKHDLEEIGYTCPIDVCPILIPFDDYKKEPNFGLINKYKDDGYANILFVGRIAPNKKHEDILGAFACYQKCFNPKSRLILAGSYNGMELYYEQLQKYARLLGIFENVIFTGHIKFNEILAWYKLADVFLCMSEHEGFCVPLVEAMYFDIPIIAYNSTAIPETLGGSGVLMEEKKPDKIAWEIYKIIKNQKYKEDIRLNQRERLTYFSYENVSKIMQDRITSFIENKN